MGLLSVPVDPVPAWAKIDLQLHAPYRTFFGFGRLRCNWCGEKWGCHGCPSRESAARLFLHTASPAQRQAALDSGDLTDTDLRLRRITPTRPARHRRKPSPHSRTAPADIFPATPTGDLHGHRARDRNRPNPLTALRLELEGASR